MAMRRSIEVFAGAWRSADRLPAVRWVGLLLLCAAYLQGGLQKAADFTKAMEEMDHFGLSPAAPMAAAAIAFELGASIMILTGFYRWVGALGLAGFTMFATFLANRFWMVPAAERFASTNTFFEHVSLVGAFLLVAWYDLQDRSQP